MFPWFRDSRRRRWMNAPWDPQWEEVLHTHARFFPELSSDDQEQLRNAIKVLVAEKNWEGCRGLEMTWEIKVVIAAHAARLTLALPQKFYDRVQSILVYPDVYTTPKRTSVGSGLAIEGGTSLLSGQAWYRGPVILSWADALEGALGELPGHNVVLHEFAHQLDMLNGEADGVPVIENAHAAERWQSVMARHYHWLCGVCRRGEHSVLDCYGTKDHAEFFAVATEAFFEASSELQTQLPELYTVLRDFYGQDPAHSLGMIPSTSLPHAEE